MRATPGFDPEHYSYGPATLAVRRLLAAWHEVDWFAPPSRPGASERAVRLFERHTWLARQHCPDEFPTPVELTVVHGDWARFTALAMSVRTSTSWE